MSFLDQSIWCYCICGPALNTITLYISTAILYPPDAHGWRAIGHAGDHDISHQCIATSYVRHHCWCGWSWLQGYGDSGLGWSTVGKCYHKICLWFSKRCFVADCVLVAMWLRETLFSSSPSDNLHMWVGPLQFDAGAFVVLVVRRVTQNSCVSALHLYRVV